MSATSYCEESGITHHGFPTRRWYADICINWGMRSNKQQELFFWQWRGREGGLDETLRVPNDYVFIFATEKEHNFQTDENIALLHLKRKKKTCLSSHRYFVVYCHRSHNAIYSPLKRERAAWWDWITIAEETAFTSVPLTKRKSKLFV